MGRQQLALDGSGVRAVLALELSACGDIVDFWRLNPWSVAFGMTDSGL